jgi:hypothetical protein
VRFLGVQDLQLFCYSVACPHKRSLGTGPAAAIVCNAPNTTSTALSNFGAEIATRCVTPLPVSKIPANGADGTTTAIGATGTTGGTGMTGTAINAPITSELAREQSRAFFYFAFNIPDASSQLVKSVSQIAT